MAIQLRVLLVLLPCMFTVISAIPSFNGGLHFAGGLNETCTRDSDCTTRNAHCQDSFPVGNEKCQCNHDHFDYESKPENCPELQPPPASVVSCLPVRNNQGDQCGSDFQCTNGQLGNNSFCDEGTCKCLPDSIYSELTYACVIFAKKLNDPCESGHRGGQCSKIPYARCSAGTCICGEGRVESAANHGTCILAANKVGDSCDKEGVMCSILPNTTCQGETNKKTCLCKDATFIRNEDGTGCIPLATKLGDPCEETVQCSKVGNSRCQLDSNLNTTCQCKPGYVESGATTKTCLKIIADTTANCSDNAQCTAILGEHGECNGNPKKCRCKATAVLHNHHCYPSAYIGEPCHFDEQCKVDRGSIPPVLPIGHSLSCRLDHTTLNESISVCSCPNDTHIEYHGLCYPHTGFGELCADIFQCQASLGLTVECSNTTKTCVCPATYMLSRDGGRCIKKTVALKQKCEEARQCSPAGANTNQYCDFDKGTCECRRGFPEVGTSCGRNSTETTTPKGGSNVLSPGMQLWIVISLAMLLKY